MSSQGGQVVARLRCFPLNKMISFQKMVEEMWNFLKFMRDKPDGFDFGDWQVKYFDWQYSESGDLLITVPEATKGSRQ